MELGTSSSYVGSNPAAGTIIFENKGKLVFDTKTTMQMAREQKIPIRVCSDAYRHESHIYERHTMELGEQVSYVAACPGKSFSEG